MITFLNQHNITTLCGQVYIARAFPHSKSNDHVIVTTLRAGVGVDRLAQSHGCASGDLLLEPVLSSLPHLAGGSRI